MPSPAVQHRFDALTATLTGWPRRALALLCLGLAVLALLRPSSGSAIRAGATVVVTTRPLQPGAVLAAADVRATRWPAADVPAGTVATLADVIGRPIGAAMARGEPVTASRLLNSAISRSLTAGQVALAVTLATGEQAAIVQPGALISLYATADSAPLVEGQSVQKGAASGSRALASAVRVLAVLPRTGDGNRQQFSVVIATDPSTAARLAGQPLGELLATLLPPS